MKQSLTRRQFLKTTAIGAAAAYLSPSAIGGTSPVLAEDLKQRVIIGSHRNLVDASEQIVPKIVRAVVDDTLVALTNTASARDAWLQLLPNLQSHDVIGIKVNCINRRQSSHPPVVYALAESLIESLDFNPNHLLIWDRTSRELKRAHYTINTGKTGVRCLGTSDGIGYDESFAVDVGNDREVHLSKILTEMCTYLINVPVLKDHGIAGITLSLKNHYGSIDRPGVCHGGGCDPYAAHLNATPHIKDKTALILCDALFGIYRGGPGGSPQWINRQLLASVDPVALDYTGMTIIDHQRQQRNISLASARTRYLQTAAALGIGSNNPDVIEAVNLRLG